MNSNLILTAFEKLIYSSLPLTTGQRCQQLVSSVIFANRLDPDQGGENVGPDLDQICPTLKEFFEKVDFEHEKLPSIQRPNKSTCSH